MPGIMLGTEGYQIKKARPSAYSLELCNLVGKTDIEQNEITNISINKH